MPQKTKQQKIAANKHRETISNKKMPIISNTPYVYAPKDAGEQDMTRFVIGDLKKTLILTTAILILEFIIFYANLKGIVSLIH